MIEAAYRHLGNFNPSTHPTPIIDVHRRAVTEKEEELRAAYSRVDELTAALDEARLQLEYLHEKFQPTGSGEATLARINDVLDQFPGVA